MLTFLLRIYYAFIIKMLPFEVFRQKLSISFKGEHSTTTWTKFYPILTPTPLEWTKMDILDTIHPMSRGLSYDPPIPLFLST